MSEPHEGRPQWLQVAHILRPRGNKGEVVAELLSDFPGRFSRLKKVHLRKDEGEPQLVALENFWLDQNHPGMGVFHFAGCSNIDDAEKLRGLQVLVPLAERVSLPAGKYFVTDLIGCTVFRIATQESMLSSPACALAEAPAVLGTVRDVFLPGETVAGTPLLQVDTSSGELLVPLAEDICVRIDVPGRRIEVALPEGLDELNSTER